MKRGYRGRLTCHQHGFEQWISADDGWVGDMIDYLLGMDWVDLVEGGF